MKRSRDRKSSSSGGIKATPTTSSQAIKRESVKSKGLGGIEEVTLQKIKENSKLDLSTLVCELSVELGYKRDRILQRLMELEASKRINIQEKTPYNSFFDYARSPISLWFWGAVAATLLSLTLIGVSGGVALYLRYVFGGLLILFLPGFSLIEFLYSKKKELDQLTRLALSIGLSLAIVPLIGLVLNYTPFGIRLIPVAMSLAGFTLIFHFLALRQKHAYYKIANDVM